MSTSEKDYGDEQLALRITRIRAELGLSMDAFAARLNVSQPTQSRIERAKRLPDALYLRNLRELFGIDINALLTSEAPDIGATQSAATSSGIHLSQSGSGVQIGHAGGDVTVGAPATPRKRRKS